MKKKPKSKALWTRAFPDQVKSKPEIAVRIKPMSDKRRADMKQYMAQRVKFLSGKKCAVYPRLAATDVHHMRGRAGALLLEEAFWLPVSRKGHEWIGSNITAAREAGFLCAAGEWGKQP